MPKTNKVSEEDKKKIKLLVGLAFGKGNPKGEPADYIERLRLLTQEVTEPLLDLINNAVHQAELRGVDKERKRMAGVVKQMLIEVPNGETCTKAELIDILNKAIKE